MPSDIEIARAAAPLPIRDVAAELGLAYECLEPYGHHKAKLPLELPAPFRGKPDGKLILVTAISPTPAGEGKTTVSVGLADALRRIGKNAVLALREPSLGPVFGVKGGAAGGGYAQVLPMEDINLHFTGDFHAVTAANNLLAALIDNHIHHGNALGIDPRRVTWKRCLDMNDRQLRQIVGGLGGVTGGVPREDGFDITAASEVMAVFCLASDAGDLKRRLRRIVIGRNYGGEPVTAGDLNAQGAMAALLRGALRPNLAQTLEHTPALIHGGPFANIAHGCNSVLATRTALKLGDYVVTEAGFGADLGAEKFLNIKCRQAGLWPAAAVVVATARALKSHGGAAKTELCTEDLDALRRGLPNLDKHLENLRQRFGLPAAVAVNRFPTDTDAELSLIQSHCQALGVPAALTEVWGKGGAGGETLAQEVVRLCAGSAPAGPNFLYPDELPLEEKITRIASEIYGGGAVFAPAARKELERLTQLGYGHLPVCMAKTQYSLSDDPKRLARPTGFQITVRSVKLSAGAGFVVALTGDIMTMPGLSKSPAAERIDISPEGEITGLF